MGEVVYLRPRDRDHVEDVELEPEEDPELDPEPVKVSWIWYVIGALIGFSI